MNAEKAASTMRWRAGVSSERGWRCFAVACVGMILLDSVPDGTIASKQLVPHGTTTKQNVQGGSHGKTSPRHFSGRRQAGQDRAARIQNAAQARDSGSRLCAVLGGRPYPAHAAKLFVRTGLRMVGNRS